jgi:hypothetical protein
VIEFDDSRYPLVISTTREAFTAGDAILYEDTINSLYDRDERFALVSLASGVKAPNPRVIRRLGSWLRDTRALRREYIIATGIYLDAPVLRNVLSFLNSLAPSPVPQELFATPDEAIAYAERMLHLDNAPPQSRTG